MMLYEFLQKNRSEILSKTGDKALSLAGARPSSDQLNSGLPLFFDQLTEILQYESHTPSQDPQIDPKAMSYAATKNDEPAMAIASGRPDQIVVARTAGAHGAELLRLGYTLSHAVHTYGAMCQSITELANLKKVSISANEFRDLNMTLDVAIAGAVTQHQALWKSQVEKQEVEHLGSLAHELRNALGTVNLSLELIKDGTVGFSGSIGQVLDRGLLRIEELIDRSLAEVRLRVEPTARIETFDLMQILNQIVLTSEIEARAKGQILEIKADPFLIVEGDPQHIYSAISNLIQNAIKYTHKGGRIQVRGQVVDESIVIEVEDECGGLPEKSLELFKPFVQKSENRNGLGLGLTIAKRSVELNHGTIGVTNIPKKGCIFKIVLPRKVDAKIVNSKVKIEDSSAIKPTHH